MSIRSFQDLVVEAKKGIREISPEDLYSKMSSSEKMVIIDVREADSHREGRVFGAVNIPRGSLEMEIGDRVRSPDHLIVVHCGGGGRSALAARTLQKMGYKNIYSLTGGFKLWKDKGFPVSPADDARRK